MDSKASAYLFGDEYRIYFNSAKQKYYFAIPVLEDETEENLKKRAESFFSENRNDVAVAKCIRCSKWHVVEGQFCERCKEAMLTLSETNTYLEVET